MKFWVCQQEALNHPMKMSNKLKSKKERVWLAKATGTGQQRRLY